MANEPKVVAVATFNVTDGNIDIVLRQMRDLLDHAAPAQRGFNGAMLLTSEDRTRVVFVSKWDSRDAWAQAEWDERISRGVADLYEETASYEIRLYHVVADR